jgi:hypothetical protein
LGSGARETFRISIQLKPLFQDPSVEFEDPQTPTMQTFDTAETHDWQHRASIAEHEVSINAMKLTRERRKTRGFQIQIKEYMEALAHSTQECTRITSQYHLALNTNFALSRDLHKAKVMIETLEAVIVLLHTTSKQSDGRVGKAGLKGGEAIDIKQS